MNELLIKAESLKTARLYAQERAEACRVAWLTGSGTEARFTSWANKASELGEKYYEILDIINDME